MAENTSNTGFDSDLTAGGICGDDERPGPQQGFGPNDLPVSGYRNGGYDGEAGTSRWRADVGQCRTKPIRME